MLCPNDDKLASLATGRLGPVSRRIVHLHLTRCSDCRSRYDTLAPLLRGVLHTVSQRRGQIHPAPRELRARIFNAIEEDRSRRADLVRRPVLRLVPAVAAAAVLIAAVLFGARLLLREDPAAGKLYRDGGAVLVARGWERLALQQRDSQQIRPGDIVLVAPGGEGSFSLREAGYARFSGSLLAVVGDLDSGPALYVIRGTLSLQSSQGQVLRVSTGAQDPSVAGSAVVEVLPEDPATCMLLARGISTRLLQANDQGLMRSAQADVPTTTRAPSTVRVHSTAGQVGFGSGLPPVTAGSEILFQTDGNFQGPALVGAGSLPLKTGGGVLTQEEEEQIPDLLARETDALASLLSAAADPALASSDRGLAVWLLGEFGDPSVIEELSELLDPDRGIPVVVRAAAVRSLSLLGEADLVSLALDDHSPAVVDAAIQAIARRFPSLAGETLLPVIADGDRSPSQRALAAAMLDELGVEISLPYVLSLCHSDDPHAVRIGDRLLVSFGSEQVRPELRTLLGSAGVERKTAILRSMAAISVSGAETIAQHALHERDYPHLRAAAISYLTKVSAEDLLSEIGGILEEDSGPARHAILMALLYLDDTESFDLTPHRAAVRGVLLEQAPDSSEVVAALAFLRNDADLTASFIGRSSSAEVRRQAIERANPTTLLAEIDHLIIATKDEDPSLRKTAWSALARIDSEQALMGIVAQCTKSRGVHIEEYLPALDRISRDHIGKPQAEQLLRMIEPLLAQAADPALRARLLTMLPPPQAADILIRVLVDEGETLAVRAAAAEALARAANSAREWEALRDALASPHEAVTSRIALALHSRRTADDISEAAAILRGAPRHDYARAVLAIFQPIDNAEAHDLLLRGDNAATALLLTNLPPEALNGMPEAVLAAARSQDAGIACLALQRLAASAEAALAAADLLGSPDPFLRLAAEGTLLRTGAGLDARRLRSSLDQAAGSRHGAAIRSFLEELSDTRTLADLRNAMGHDAFGFRLQTLACLRDDARLASLAARSGIRNQRDLTKNILKWRKKSAFQAERQAAVQKLAAGATRHERISAIQLLGNAGKRADVGLLLQAAADPDAEVSRAARSELTTLLSRGGQESHPQELSDLEGWWRQRAYALEVPVSR